MKKDLIDNSQKFDIGLLKDEIHKLAKSENINKWDIGASASRDLSVQVDHGESKQLKGSQRSSITIRVWNKNKALGITSTSDLSNRGISKALLGAAEASNYGNKEESPDFSPLANEPLPKKVVEINQQTGIEKLLKILKDAESQLINSHQYINSVPYNGLSESTIERAYINSEGAMRQMKLSHASIYLYAKGEEIGRKPRSAGSAKFSSGINSLDISSCIKECSKKIISHISYQPIKTDKYLVCFSPEAFLDLLNAFSSLFNARSILDGTSLNNLNSIGEDISVPFLNLSDEALNSSNIGSFTFDGEGTPKKNIKLINNGKLVNLLHSEATARKFKVQPTGHASMGAKAAVSPEWFVVSKSSTNEFINKSNLNHKTTQENFVYIDSLNALHAGVKASQGSFSLPFDGWKVEKGAMISIEAATVAGDIKRLLNSIVQIENDKTITTSGICPHIWVSDLSITGEA